MATLAVLQIGDAIAGATLATVDVGNALLCTLSLFDESQLALAADAGSVVATLAQPGGTSVALTVVGGAQGVYTAAASFLVAGGYGVTFSGTTGAGAFLFVVSGGVVCGSIAVVDAPTSLGATEDAGAVQLARTKLVLGALGVDGGDVSLSNPLPVLGVVAVSNFPSSTAGSVTVTNPPVGYALDATLTGGAAKTQSVDAAGNLAGTSTHPVRTDPTGTTVQPVSVSGTAAVSVAATVAVSAAALPLPAGAAQDTTLTARLGTLGQKTSAASAPVVLASDQPSLPVTGSIAVSNLPATQPVSGSVAIVGTAAVSIAATLPVSVSALPLPAGAAQDATLSARLGTLGQKLAAGSTPVVLASDQGSIPVSVTFPGTQPVSIAATVPVSGTVAVSNLPSTQAVSAVALPLPAGAAQDATLTGRLGTLGQKAMAGSAPVAIASDQGSLPVTVGNFPATQPVSGSVAVSGTIAVSNLPATQAVSIAAAVAVTAVSLPLPTGAALDATFTARLGTLGQKLAAGSAPVVLASDQGALPVSGTVAVSNLQATQPVSAVSLPLPAGAALDATLIGGTQKTQIFDGTSVLGTTAHPVKTDPTGTTTQPVSGTVAVSGTVPISIAAALPAGANALGSVSVSNLPGTQPVSGSVTATQGTAAAATAPWPAQLSDGAAAYVGAKTGQLPAALVGGRVDANNGAWLGSTAPTVGAKTGANSLPVVLASDQATLAVSAASLPLPAGASQDATLTGGTQKTQLYDGTNVIGTAAHPVSVTATPIASATPAQSSVAGSATNVVLLASNTSRKGATIFNDSTATLYVKLGVTASLTSHTVQLLAGAYYELPFAYNGEVDGLWATAAGSARVTELT